jgi:hypothetical protein
MYCTDPDRCKKLLIEIQQNLNLKSIYIPMVNTYMREELGTNVRMTENNEAVISFLHFLSVGAVI